MSSWLGDFLHAYKQHPISAVVLLAALISACAVAGVAYAIRYDSPVPVQTTVTRPAQGQVPAGRPRPRGLPRPSNIVPALPLESTTVLESPRTVPVTVPASRPAASPSASPTASPDALPTPSPSASTLPTSPSDSDSASDTTSSVTQTPSDQSS